MAAAERRGSRRAPAVGRRLVPMEARTQLGMPQTTFIAEKLNQHVSFESSRRGLAGRRVLVLLESLELGGAERQAIHLARYLQEYEDAVVEVWGWGMPGRAADLCYRLGLPWRTYRLAWHAGRWRRLVGVAALARQLAHWQPDLVVPYCRVPNIVAGLVWRWAGATGCIWNQRDTGLDLGASRLERWAVRRVPAIVANSHHAAQRLSRLFRPRQPIHVVPNGVRLEPPAASRAEWRGRLGVDERCVVAVMVANVHRAKDHVTALRAWHRVVQRLDPLRFATATPNTPTASLAGHLGNPQTPGALLLLAGRLDEPAVPLAMMRELGLQAYVRFLGAVDDVSGLLSAADLGLFASLAEGCPNGILECMAAGLPVVATVCPGTTEVLGSAGQGLLVPAQDDAALAERILLLAGNPTLRRTLGEANRRRAQNEYTWEMMGRTMATLLAGLLERPAAASRHAPVPKPHAWPAFSRLHGTQNE